jgi:hypothetical protein
VEELETGADLKDGLKVSLEFLKIPWARALLEKFTRGTAFVDADARRKKLHTRTKTAENIFFLCLVVRSFKNTSPNPKPQTPNQKG